MSNRNRKVNVRIIKGRDMQPVKKADTPVQLSKEEALNAGDWITPEINQLGLKTMVKHSTILPQCIRAYRNNICGFGIGVRYIDDEEETPERKAEFDKAVEIIELLNTEEDTKEVFEDVIEAREIYGIAYIEVIRNLAGEVCQIEFITETPSITKTRPLEPYMSTKYYHHGEQTERQKKFCKYKQELGGKTVYFKEFGDPRIMDRRTGEYLSKGKRLELEYQANELMEFKIGTDPYGEVRWIGQSLGVDGSRRAENLNNNYFRNGRHTPLMILLQGGTLSDESYDKLQTYMDDIKGETGQHSFMILETESTDGRTDFDQTDKPTVEIKDLASILQKDELFQDYLDNNRRKVQSAFQLPDLYVAYTTDFNRATAQTAQEVTEEQVFQPERKSLAWAINNRLLNEYQFKYVEAYFLEPDISNADDIFKLMNAANNAGGLTPNKAKEILYEALGDVSEDFDEEWGDIPLAFQNQQEAPQEEPEGALFQLSQQIQKAEENHDDEIVAVMKEVRNLLTKTQKNDKKDFTNATKTAIIKDGEVVEKFDDFLHPRDEHGRFAAGKFGEVSTKEYEKAITEAKASRPDKDRWRVDAHEESEYIERGCRCFVSAQGSTVAVTEDGDIISVCKDKSDTVRGQGDRLIQQAVQNGGTKLDSYAGNHSFYAKNGFEPVSWCKWSDEGADEGWINRDWLEANGLSKNITTAELQKIPNEKLKYPREDIIFYKYTGNIREDEEPDDFLETVPASVDYDAAKDARNASM